MEILLQYLPLCWFKSHPLQLPDSKAFFKQNLIFYFVAEFLAQANMITVSEAFVEVIMDVGLTLVFVWVLLSVNRSMHNFIQIATAVLFCENVVSLFAVPIIAWVTLTHSLLSYLFLVVVIVWNYALITYIMKKVLAVDTTAGIIVALLYFICIYVVAYSLTLAF